MAQKRNYYKECRIYSEGDDGCLIIPLLCAVLVVLLYFWISSLEIRKYTIVVGSTYYYCNEWMVVEKDVQLKGCSAANLILLKNPTNIIIYEANDEEPIPSAVQDRE